MERDGGTRDSVPPYSYARLSGWPRRSANLCCSSQNGQNSRPGRRADDVRKVRTGPRFNRSWQHHLDERSCDGRFRRGVVRAANRRATARQGGRGAAADRPGPVAPGDERSAVLARPIHGPQPVVGPGARPVRIDGLADCCGPVQAAGMHLERCARGSRGRIRPLGASRISPPDAASAGPPVRILLAAGAVTVCPVTDVPR